MTWRQSNSLNKPRSKILNWPDIGPLRRGLDRLFSQLVYQDNFGPVPLMIWQNEDMIIILAKIEHLVSEKLNLTVGEQSLLLNFSQACDEPKAETDPPFDQANEQFLPYVINFPYPIDLNQIETDVDDDLLHLRLRRAQKPETEAGVVH